MILENHTPSFWAIFLLPHTRTHSQMAFLSRWQRGGRADSEGHGDAEKKKKKVFELDTRHSSLPASFYDEIFSFFQYWFICILCVLDIAVWLQGRLFGKEDEKNFFFFFPKTIVKVLLNQREKKNKKTHKK